MERINPFKKNVKALESAIKKALKEIKEEDFNFYQIYIKPTDVKEQIRLGRKENEIPTPFILIRPMKATQKYIQGAADKKADFLIRIGIQDDDEGFYKISDLGEYLVAYFTKYPMALMERDGYDYHIDLNHIESYLNEDLTAGDFWFYDIILKLNIPSVSHAEYIMKM